MKKKSFTTYVWIAVICLLMPIITPILAAADADVWTMECGGAVRTLSIEPYRDDLGLMVDARDAAQTFSLDCDFDAENKSFTIIDENSRKTVLMHNATQFFSGDKIYNCAAYFRAENSVPMVELDFFCKMFESSYELSGKKIIIHKGKLSSDTPKLTKDGKTMPLYITPHKTDAGMVTGAEDLAKAFGLEYTYNPDDESMTLYDEKHGRVILNNGAEKFTSSGAEFECSPFYFTEDGIPVAEIEIFCNMYGAAYTYDEQTKTLTITDKSAAVKVQSSPARAASRNLSGVAKLTKKELPYGAYMEIMLQPNGTRYELYKVINYTGPTRYLTAVNIPNYGTHQSFSYDLSEYVQGYPEYSLFYELHVNNLNSTDTYYGYFGANGAQPLSAAPDTSKYMSETMHFSASANSNANFDLDKHFSSYRLAGKVSLDYNIKAPGNGIDVQLVAQTLTKNRPELYQSLYTTGKAYNLGTVHLAEGAREVDFDYTTNLKPYNNHLYYVLYYKAAGNGCTKPYGYINDKKTAISINSFSTTDINSDSYFFVKADSSDVHIKIPLLDSYVANSMLRPPTASVPEGKVAVGTKVELISDTEGADIYYTTEENPEYSSFKKYTAPITINKSVTIRTMAVKSGMQDSYTAAYTYLIPAEPEPPEEEDILYGDVDNNGIVNRVDLLRLSKYFAGTSVTINEKAADVNADGTLDASDLLHLSKYFAGWNVKLGKD